MPEVRLFERHDRDALTTLANRHIAAVLPGGAVPIATLLSQMERDVGEYIVDPWVIDRCTIVAIEAQRVVAAVHLKRYGADEPVSASYRDAAEIAWCIADPSEVDAGRSALAAAMAQLTEWQARIWYADGGLPCLGVYGIPDAWPHVEHLLSDAGFTDDDGQIELVYAGDISSVAEPGPAPVEGVGLRRVVGPLGTSFEAWLNGQRIGLFEVEDCYGIANAQLTSWADEANHWVSDGHRGHGVGTWLVRHGCRWLRLGGKTRLLAYAVERRGQGLDPMENTPESCTPYYARFGLTPITRTRRGWHRSPS